MKNKVLIVSPRGPNELGRIRRLHQMLLQRDFVVDFLLKESFNEPNSQKGIKRVYSFFLVRFFYLLRSVSIGEFRMIVHRMIYNGMFQKYLTVQSDYNIIFIEHINFIYFPSNLKSNEQKIIFDVKDYFPRNFEDRILWRLFVGRFYGWLFQNYLGDYNAVLSVSTELQNLLFMEYGLHSFVLPNSLCYCKSTNERRQGQLRFVYSGSCSSERGVIGLINIFKELKHLNLYLYLVGSEKEINSLIGVASNAKNIIFKNAVQLNSIVKELSQYDVCLINFTEGNLNNYYSLPNKFYEAIQARLFILSTPCESMAELIRKYDIGLVSLSFNLNDFSDLVQSVNRDIYNCSRLNLERAASELTFELYSSDLIKFLHE